MSETTETSETAETAESTESRFIKACEAAKREVKPNITKIAREYGVPRRTLCNRFKKYEATKTLRKSVKRALNSPQEEGLTRWIAQVNEWNIPPAPKLIEAWANSLLARAGKVKQPVSKMWVYRFIKRLPPDLKLGKAKQQTKESNQIKAEDVAHWYDLLKTRLEGVPARLVYNLDECGLRPTEGINHNVVGKRDPKKSCPDIAETERGKNITALECIAADGWQMDPLFITKRNGSVIECWVDGNEDSSQNEMVVTSQNDWASDILTNQWLDRFIKATATRDRTKRGEKRILIFDGHGAYLTLEFLQKCKDHDILPFGFLPHSTQFCQPLDGEPFLDYKQHLQSLNSEISYWAGKPMEKTELLQVIKRVRSKAFNQRIIRESFKERGVYPVDGNKVLSKLPEEVSDNTPDPISPDLRFYGPRTPPPGTNLLSYSVENSPDLRPYDSRTPSPAPNFSISSVENSPSKSTEALQKNAGSLTPELQHNLERLVHHNRLAIDHLTMANDTIMRIMAGEQLINRLNNKRQFNEVNNNSMLKIRDANSSIAARKAREDSADEWFAKEYKKRYGCEPPQPVQQETETSINAARIAQENNEILFIDSTPMHL